MMVRNARAQRDITELCNPADLPNIEEQWAWISLYIIGKQEQSHYDTKNILIYANAKENMVFQVV